MEKVKSFFLRKQADVPTFIKDPKNLRDSKGRPYYLTSLPFYKRNRFWTLYLGIALAVGMFAIPSAIKTYISGGEIDPEDQRFWTPLERVRGARAIDAAKESLKERNRLLEEMRQSRESSQSNQ